MAGDVPANCIGRKAGRRPIKRGNRLKIPALAIIYESDFTILRLKEAFNPDAVELETLCGAFQLFWA